LGSIIYSLATSNKDNGKTQPKYNYKDVYVHAKLFVVDDEWYSIDSANISYQSLRTDSEINVAVWDHKGAKKLRKDLWREHLFYSDTTKIQYNQEVIIDDNIEDAFEQWWFFARANNYHRTTNARAENRLMPLDLRKYSLFRRIIGFIKDIPKISKKWLFDLFVGLIEKIRKHL
jgi:phosphatidylserine/phosphatidylglycerophosphate/cardiolipin synthase-like enzyme